MITDHKKILITFFIIALAVLAQGRWLDDIGLNHTQAGLQRALVTYGVSRGLNGVVSVVQGTEVAIEPVGVGMTFTPGQILDPVNDLVERFSGIVLVSGTAFGVQRVLLDVVASRLFSILILCSVGLLLLSACLRKSHLLNGDAWNVFLCRSVIILMIVRFSIPLIAIVSETAYEHFLEPSYKVSSSELLLATQKLQEIQTQSESASNISDEPKSLLDSARAIYQTTANKFDMQSHINDFKKAASRISEHAIELIVVFVVQTLLLPLLSVWVTLKAIRWVAFKRFTF